MKQRILIIIGLCIVIGSLGTGLVVVYQQHYDIKPVADQVGDVPTATSTNSSLTVADSSPADGFEQADNATNNASDTSSTTDTDDSSSELAQLTNPTTFSQYSVPKYEDGNEAFYANLQTGTGATLSTAGQKAVVSYKGWLTNGTLFDETKVNAQGQSEPFEFTYEANPEQVISGLDEGMSGMKVGGTRLLIVPPAAGYGATAHDAIPANAVLIFEVTLDEIQ